MLHDEMLTIDDLARFLRLRPQTIYRWAQAGKIPGAKIGKEWRFRRSAIERWVDSCLSNCANAAGNGAARGQARRAQAPGSAPAQGSKARASRPRAGAGAPKVRAPARRRGRPGRGGTERS